MSTTAEATPESDEGVDPQQEHAERVNALAEDLYATKLTRNHSKAPGEREKEARLWKEAYSEAKRVVRNDAVKTRAKSVARSAAISARAETSSVAHRNRAQLAPWLLAAPYAATGQAGALMADYATGVSPLGMGITCAAAAAGGSYAAWKTKLRKRVPAKFRAKVQAGLGLLCGWTAAMPLADGAGQAGMWLALVAGTGYLGLSWWRDNDHPIPAARDTVAVDAGQSGGPTVEAESARTRRIRGIVQAWTDRLSHKDGAVPGSSLTWLESSDAVDKYLIQLDPAGKITRKQVKKAHESIALAVGVLEDDLSFEYTKAPSTIIMRHLVSRPTFAYDGPVVLCNGAPIHSRWDVTPGADVDIVFGSYIDGDGSVAYRLIQKGSVNSAFLLGGMGSGKTRAAEIIAIGLRFLGCYLLWIDGQGGGSSPLLNRHAHETFAFNMYDRSDDTGVAEFTAAIAAIAGRRNQDLRERPKFNGEYTYSPSRPPVVALMDEAHELFQTVHPTEGTYGHRLGAYASQIRKCGVAFVALSQDYDKTNTFGGSSRLRDGLVVSGNLIAMRQMDRSRVGMLPSTCPPLDTVPATGFGYLPLQQRPDALWCTFNLGKDSDEVAETAQRWMGAYEPGALEFDRDTASATPDEPGTAGGNAGGGSGSVVRFPGAAGEASPVDADVSMLSDADQRTLAIVQGAPQTPTTLASNLNITRQGAGKKLAALAGKGFLAKLEDGRYMAKV